MAFYIFIRVVVEFARIYIIACEFYKKLLNCNTNIECKYSSIVIKLNCCLSFANIIRLETPKNSDIIEYLVHKKIFPAFFLSFLADFLFPFFFIIVSLAR